MTDLYYNFDYNSMDLLVKTLADICWAKDSQINTELLQNFLLFESLLDDSFKTEICQK